MKSKLCVFPVALALGCGSASNGPDTEVTPSLGGSAASSGGATGAGGTSNLAGAVASTGGLTASGGATTSGGALSSGGHASGGAVGSGGQINANGGNSASGGHLQSGGSGGSSARGGASAGGQSSGGATTSGGANTGGAASAGATSCDWSDPPANVAAWVNESWQSQLGNNVKTRKDWLLDSIMLGKGQINVCVRWGASSAPTAAVKQKLAPSLGRFMSDWFKALGTYGCFPYPNGVDVKITGWAVKPGNESWVSDLDSSIRVYTETDSDGEPKCPDACSFFNNWTHQFPNCPGGEAYHTDYWAWFDDQLPGGGGAAAVGGDWGFRMPLSSFVRVLDQPSTIVAEHEMGHGFGFQDYYDWTGSTPNGGSLMIVGSTSNQAPSVGDTWLLRRTWKEVKALRGW